MCGRAKLTVPFSVIAKLYRAEATPDLPWVPRTNIPPMGTMLVVRRDGPQRRLQMMRWGLVPSWAKDPKIGNKMFNARAETVATKPSFRAAFRKRRCLVLCDGFYEWSHDGSKKVPNLIHDANDTPLALAGLWESWTSPDGEVLETCTVITRPSEGIVKELHDRMPVILPEEDQEAWLEPSTVNPEQLEALLSHATWTHLRADVLDKIPPNPSPPSPSGPSKGESSTRKGKSQQLKLIG